MVPRWLGARRTGLAAQRLCRRGVGVVGALPSRGGACPAACPPGRGAGRGAAPDTSLEGAALRAAAAPGGRRAERGASPAAPKFLALAAPVSGESAARRRGRVAPAE